VDHKDETRGKIMNHREVLKSAASILNDRLREYGPEELCFQRIAGLATIVLNKHMDEYDIAMIMHCVKLGRLQESRGKSDSYIDGINYLAFAAQFADAKNPPEPFDQAVEDEIRTLAQKYAPIPNREETV
jgi:hypothetical protein